MLTTAETSNRHSIISALLAGFIWMAITASIGGYSAAAEVGGGIAFVVGAAIVTYLIFRFVSRSHSPA